MPPRRTASARDDGRHQLGLRDHTIVVVLSDNGFHLGEHDTWGKMTLFDRDARVPLVISAPATGGTPATTSAICELIDIFPTLTELGGLPTPLECDAVSLVPVLEFLLRAERLAWAADEWSVIRRRRRT